jgi:hypothetical protein
LDADYNKFVRSAKLNYQNQSTYFLYDKLEKTQVDEYIKYNNEMLIKGIIYKIVFGLYFEII